MFGAYEEGTQNIIDATDADKKKKYICPECGSKVAFKPGHGFKKRHFACLGGDVCDGARHDGPSQWHTDHQYNIKNAKSGVNIEVIFKSEYKKRADQLLPSGYVVEYQKSPINPDERERREYVYAAATGKPLIWFIHDDLTITKTFTLGGRLGKNNPLSIVFRERKGGNIINAGIGKYEIDITKEEWVNIIVNNPYINIEKFIVRRAIHNGLKRIRTLNISLAWNEYGWFEDKLRRMELQQQLKEEPLKEIRIQIERKRYQWACGFVRWIPYSEPSIYEENRLYPENPTRFSKPTRKVFDIIDVYEKDRLEREALKGKRLGQPGYVKYCKTS